MPSRIFILGEHGQLARALATSYAARGDIAINAGRAAVDAANPHAIREAVLRFRPDLVVNAAAYTAVDKAEEEVADAFAINRDLAARAAEAAHFVRAPFIHVSTDYVFDGRKPDRYSETDTPNPLGVYGQSKLAGEQRVAAATDRHVILRTTWLCSPDGHNFVKTILRLAKERDAISVVDDQWGAPTFATDLAQAVATIGEKLMAAGNHAGLKGIYHATGAGETTWCGFARAIIAKSATMGGPTCRIDAIATGEFPTKARRPYNSRLDCTKLARAFGLRLPAWESSLKACLCRILLDSVEARR